MKHTHKCELCNIIWEHDWPDYLCKLPTNAWCTKCCVKEEDKGRLK